MNKKSSDSNSSFSDWVEQRHQRRKTRQKRRRNSRGGHDTDQHPIRPHDTNSTRSHRRPAVIGRGLRTCLGAAPTLRDVALFASRMLPDAPVENLVSHVKEIADVERVDCEQLQRHPSYSSFKMCINGIKRDQIKYYAVFQFQCYLHYDDGTNNEVYIDYLAKIHVLMDHHSNNLVLSLSVFNVHPGSVFG